MANHGDFKPNIYVQHLNANTELLHSANIRPSVYDSQPVFPGDYRQFINYPIASSNEESSYMSYGYEIPTIGTTNSHTILGSNPIQHGYSISNTALKGDGIHEHKDAEKRNTPDETEGFVKMQVDHPISGSCNVFDEKSSRIHENLDNYLEFLQKQKQGNRSEVVEISSDNVNSKSSCKNDKDDNLNITTEKSDETDRVVVVKEEPLSDNEQNDKTADECEKNLYEESTESENDVSDSSTSGKKVVPETKSKKGKKLLKSFVPKKKTEYACDVCGKVVQSLRTLNKHKNLHTENFKCDKCNKIFNSAVSLKNHDKVHSGFKGDEKCNVCFKKFYDKSSLNKHTLSVHMGIKNFQCDYCHLSFFARKTYEEHVRVHTGERPFKCDLCPKTYKRISDLNHHLRLHKGEISHTCEKCGEGFRRSSELKRHMTKHSETFSEYDVDVRFPAKSKTCVFCGLIFSTLKSLNEHISSHMDLNGQSLTFSSLQKHKNAFEKEQMVNQIVNELGTNLIESNDVTEKIHDERTSKLDDNKGISQELNPKSTLNSGSNNYFSNSSDLSYINDREHDNTSKATDDFGSAYFGGTVEEHSSSMKGFNDASASETKNMQKIGENCGVKNIQNGLNDMESFSAQIEIVTDLDDVDYGGDTDVEDYNYVMNDSVLEESPVSEIKDGEQIIKVEEDKFGDRKDDKKDDMKLSQGNKRKKKTPQKKKRKIAKFSNDETEDKQNTTDKDDELFDSFDMKEEIPNMSVNSEDAESLTCTQCGKKLSNRVTLEKHMNLHLGTFSCEICGKCFSKKKSLDIHMDNHEGKKVNTAKCNVCDKSFYDNSSLNKHVKAVHMDYKPHTCPECERCFSERKTLTEHLRVHSGERPFACEYCGKTYKRAGELNFHIRKHGGEVKVNCPECNKGFMRMGLLRQHMRVKHDKERPFRCFLCGKTFSTAAMLKDHRLVHYKDRKHVCEKCGSQFYTLAKLKKHMHRKTDCQVKNFCVNGVFVCKFCYHEFESLDARKEHIEKNHVNEVPPRRTYPCHICGKKFSRPQGLKTHLKIHLNVRDYHCTQCSASFIQKHHLTQHIATHTGVKQYQCNICLKNFAHNATLYNHMKHH